MKYFLPLFLIFFTWGSAIAQKLVEATYLESASKSFIASRLPLDPLFAIDYYKVLYETTGVDGALDTASGLLALPVTGDYILPLLCLQHGTTDGKFDVPSNWGRDDRQAMLFASQGYVVSSADYIGMGESRGFHPYVHAETEASAAIDMLFAVRSFCEAGNIPLNDQLFVTGYSQGGHASMAVHQELETNFPGDFPVTAASHMSGPYDPVATLDTLLTGLPYNFSAYMAYVSLGYKELYPELAGRSIASIFKAPYSDWIENFYNGYEQGASLFSLNQMMVDQLVLDFGAPITRNIFQDSFVTMNQNDRDNPFLEALRDNITYKWTAQAPTRLLYCEADDQVPFINSIIALDSMKARGAQDIFGLSMGVNNDHVQCGEPAFFFTFLFFDSFKDLITEIAETGSSNSPSISFFPNPARDYVEVYWQGNAELPAGQLAIFDARGQLVKEQVISSGERIRLEINGLPPGIYYCQFHSGSGQIVKEFVKMR